MRRYAFTLIELLTVIAIIGILIGLLLPGVQMVREAARRTACQNNIRQIALGLENFHSQRNQFPVGWDQENQSGGAGWSWMAYNLPYLEADNLQDLIDFRRPVTDPVHEEVRKTRLPILFCPSSPDNGVTTFPLTNTFAADRDQSDVEFPLEIARSQYVGCIGTIGGAEEIRNGL